MAGLHPHPHTRFRLPRNPAEGAGPQGFCPCCCPAGIVLPREPHEGTLLSLGPQVQRYH